MSLISARSISLDSTFKLQYLNSLMQIRDPEWKNSDPGFGMEKTRIRDSGWKKLGSGIRNKHPGSATLL